MDSSPGWIGDWSPGIGDPTLIGWLTAALYLSASLLCLHAARGIGASTPVATGSGDRAAAPTATLATAVVLAFLGPKRRLLSLPAAVRARTLWVGLAIVLLLLGINKQLDLQTAVIELGRMLTRAEGWYDYRWRLEAVFLAALALGGLALVRVVFLLGRAEPPGMRSVLTGAVFLVGFVVVRAACFQHIDRLLGLELSESRLNGVVEVCGISFIIVGTYRVLRGRSVSDAGSPSTPLRERK